MDRARVRVELPRGERQRGFSVQRAHEPRHWRSVAMQRATDRWSRLVEDFESAPSIGIEESMVKAQPPVRKHSVSASVQIHQLTKAGTSIDFEIFSGAEKIGTIIIGRGSLTWFGRSRRRSIELSWTRFAKLMDEQYG